MVARACGCVCEFQHYAVDKYRAQRLAKFQKSRCPACVAKWEEEKRRAMLPKTEALKLLPAGAKVSLTLLPDGNWAGALEAEGRSVQTTGQGGAGPQATVVALARLWVAAREGAEGGR